MEAARSIGSTDLAAVDASEGKDPSVLDTYARALFDTGKVDDAIKQQKKAVELSDDADKKRVIYQPVSIELREITPRIIREDNYGGLH